MLKSGTKLPDLGIFGLEFVYNSTKHEFLFMYFRKEYPYLLMATFGISEQLI